MNSRSKKERNISIYFNRNYRTETKLILIIMDYCLLQFDALKFLLGVLLHGGSLPNFNFFNINYRAEMKLILIIMDYCLLQFDALKFFLGVRLHGSLYLTFIFSM